MPQLKPGTIEKFTILKKISFNHEHKTHTYLAQNSQNKLVLVKQIKANPENCGQVEREIECLERHKKLLAYQSKKTGRNHTSYTIVSDFIPGECFQNLIENNSFTPHQMLVLFYHLAKGLDKFHDKGYAHRDIKPDNFIINQDGIHVIDFGNAILKEYANQFFIPGKLGFMALEVTPSSSDVDPTNNQFSDLASIGYIYLWALGCLELTKFYRKQREFDFKQTVPQQLRQLQFSEQEISVLVEILEGLVHEDPKQRPNLSLVCEKLFNLCEKDVSLDWIGHFEEKERQAESSRTVEVTSMPLSTLSSLGYPSQTLEDILDDDIKRSQPSDTLLPLQKEINTITESQLRPFNRYLQQLKEKQAEFQALRDKIKDKSCKDYLKYDSAFQRTEALTETLDREAQNLICKKTPSEDDYKQFKENCGEAIDKAKPELKTHRNMNYILANVGLAVLGIGVGYAIAGVINLAINRKFLFFTETDSMKKLDKLEASLDPIKLP
ncbi:protein kinase family protein [Legionella israelensis]|uniref:protein kinase domain-containing protein n=1 Tax=Legionella israelensis TaxID=454 RepID=UPI00117D05DE|nr:protein kinase [Legionella israelensis]QDP71083.1 protein kinase family protein [Legionella israelensis]